MQLRFLTDSLANFSIRQKMWGGFVLLLTILMIVAVNTLINLADTQHKVETMTADVQPTLIASMELKNALKDATTSMGFYLLTRQAQHKQAYLDNLAKIKAAVNELEATPLLQKDETAMARVEIIAQEVEKFSGYRERMLQLAETLTENFSALGYAGTNINPISREMLQALSNMMTSEDAEEPSAERKAIYTKISNLRYTWSSVINNVRVYMFYGNDDALSNVKLFISGAKDLVQQLGEYTDSLTFEEEEGLTLLKAAIPKWEEHLKVIIDLHKGDKARMDAYLIKTEIGPLVSTINEQLTELVQEQQESTYTTGHELISEATATTRFVTTLLAVGLASGCLIAWLITRVIATPLRTASDAMRDIAEGEGDLTQRLESVGKDEIAGLSNGFNQFAEKIQSMIRQVSNSVENLISSQEELARVTDTTTDVITQQRKQTELIATAVNEMSAVSHDVAHNAELASEAAQRADRQTNEGREIVSQALQGINKLAEETESTAGVIQKLGQDVENISTVIEMIRGVTEQTNLLALNAAIEAARAGEQGRGFAVVADEVRSLASRTKDSTNEIQASIEALQRDTQQAVERMMNNRTAAQQTAELAVTAGESLNAITEAVNNITDMSYQIASASEQQSAVAEDINKNIQNISDLANQADGAANAVAHSSNGLKDISTTLNHLVGLFKY